MNEMPRALHDGAPAMRHALHQAEPVRRAPTRRAIVAAAIGNGLEMYDFTLYSFFAVTIGKLFFPTGNALTSLLLSFATFGAGFLMRPLGAVIIGNLADQRGRKAALTLTIALMTAGTALIALTPGYASIGVSATILVVIGRLLQGLSAGGEIGAASALLMESGSKARRCYFVSWQAATQGGAALVGALAGVAVSATLSPDALQSWGWRLPFLLGLLIAPVGIYIRRHLEETHVSAKPSAFNGVGAVFREHARTLVLGTFLMTSSTSAMYVIVFYMPTYLVRTLHMPQVTAFAATCVSGLTMLVFAPLFGRFADRLPRRKPLLIANSVLSMLIVIPNFMLLSSAPGLPLIMVCVAISGVLMSIGTGAGTAMMMEALPRHHRATGMSIMYSFGVTIFGGFAPLAVTWLISATGSRMAPAGYLLGAYLISFIALLFYPSNPGRD
ncbi:MFS transporter [Burkholderia sp. Ax-1719]|uniref:MFS transporter n=1 Tax=Burkholderia sp. Ax-1719 TaxID=2608334 RepID=UPI00142262F6|nr:MFS transporter [Burkholderia sp. Ax-1719]NIE64779.1 MFS transporter [Burkholderia sp. Ax-1719]